MSLDIYILYEIGKKLEFGERLTLQSMSAKTKILTVLFFGAMIAIFAYFYAPSRPACIKVGYAPYAADWPFFVAMEEELFKKQGLNVIAKKFKGSKEMMDALIAGRVDVVAPVSLPVIFGVEQNQPGLLKVIFLASERNQPEKLGIVSGVVVKKDSPIKSIRDLKGKKIGTYSGTTALVSVQLLLKANGLDPQKDVDVIQVSPELQIASFLSGQFDALFTIEPYITIIITEGYGKVIERNPRSKYIEDPFIVGGQVFLKKFFEDYPDISKRISRALKTALNFMKEHPREAREILSRWTIYQPKVAMGVGQYEWSEVSSFAISHLQRMADLYYQYKILKKPLNVAEMCK